ncbi:unnamed protein product, partial [Urochloa humidicola]
WPAQRASPPPRPAHFSSAKYELGALLGWGNFTKVYRVRCLAGGDPVAIKVLDKSGLTATGMAACLVVRSRPCAASGT